MELCSKTTAGNALDVICGEKTNGESAIICGFYRQEYLRGFTIFNLA
jgi:hypothetical protein